MENGETTEHREPADWNLEDINEYLVASGKLEKASIQMVVGLGFEGLAMHEPNPARAHSYLDMAYGYLEDALRKDSRELIPTQPLILAKMHLNLWPVITDVVVHKSMSEPETIKRYYRKFISDASSQFDRSRNFLSRSYAEQDKRSRQRDLLVAFELAAANGLLMHDQLERGVTGDELALPAFLDPSVIKSNPEYPMLPNWHINIFGKDNNSQTELKQKIFLRLQESPIDFAPPDPETVVVWFESDLALDTDKKDPRGGNFASPFVIVTELAKERKHTENIASRSEQMRAALGKRTVATVLAEQS